MIRLTLAMAMLALAGLFTFSVAPAAAAFTSHNEGTEGGANFQVSIKGIGDSINCGETETNKLAWQIKKEGKASVAGPELALKFKSWGTCVVEDKEEKLLKEVTLNGGECAWETSEPGSEREVTAKIASGCKLKGEIAKKTCEVTIEPKSNEKLSNFTLIHSGEENEHLAVNIALKGVTVGASGAGCEAAGIKSTSAGELTGTIEALEVSPGIAFTKFVINYLTTNTMKAVGEERIAWITNIGTKAAAPGNQPGNGFLWAGNAAWFSVFNQSIPTCQTTVLASLGQCQMTVRFQSASSKIVSFLLQIWEGGDVGSQVSFFAIS